MSNQEKQELIDEKIKDDVKENEKEVVEFCQCLKCGDVLHCEHDKNEPHIATLCGRCA